MTEMTLEEIATEQKRADDAFATDVLEIGCGWYRRLLSLARRALELEEREAGIWGRVNALAEKVLEQPAPTGKLPPFVPCDDDGNPGLVTGAAFQAGRESTQPARGPASPPSPAQAEPWRCPECGSLDRQCDVLGRLEPQPPAAPGTPLTVELQRALELVEGAISDAEQVGFPVARLRKVAEILRSKP